jgi:hypothetical protein
MTRRRTRSWVDLVIGWIDRVPGPAWLVYAALVVLSVVASVIPRLLDGAVIDALTVSFAALTVTPFALLHATERASRRALAEFRPALGALEPEYDELELRLTTTSAATAIMSVVLGIAIVTAGILSVRGGWGVASENSVLTNAVTIGQEVILNAALLTFLLHQIRVVRTITRIHRDATGIVLWNVRPNRAFARVTVLTAIAIVVLYVTAAVGSALTSDNPAIAAVLAILALAIATLAFAGPLVGMRRRLVGERERQLGETDRVFEEVATRLRADVDAGDFEAAARLDGVVSALAGERERLRKVPTWPWSADTLRAFLTSLGVPVALWLVTTLLGRLLFP